MLCSSFINVQQRHADAVLSSKCRIQSVRTVNNFIVVTCYFLGVWNLYIMAELLEDDVNIGPSELDRTFVFEDEGHTLGSLLTYILESFPETDFCAYSIRHPSENKIYLRLKVKNGNTVEDIFKRGFQELNQLLNHVKKTFNKAISAYEETKATE